jgi:hypothetical protein
MLITIIAFVWFFVNYRAAVKREFRRIGADRYRDIREVQAMAHKMAIQAELQARANTLYEAADLLTGKIDAANVRKELLERRNKALEQMNG